MGKGYEPISTVPGGRKKTYQKGLKNRGRVGKKKKTTEDEKAFLLEKERRNSSIFSKSEGGAHCLRPLEAEGSPQSPQITTMRLPLREGYT